MAIHSFTQSLKYYPGYISAWIQMGIAHCEAGSDQEALFCFEKAESLDPANTGVWYWKGLVLNRLGLNAEAAPYLEKYTEADPRNAEAWILLSNCKFMLGRLDESMRSFLVAYDIDKGDISSCLSQSVTHAKEKNFDDSLRSLSHAFGILIR
jgi:tetratricopeptide (TPR) repeat protein